MGEKMEIDEPDLDELLRQHGVDPDSIGRTSDDEVAVMLGRIWALAISRADAVLAEHAIHEVVACGRTARLVDACRRARQGKLSTELALRAEPAACSRCGQPALPEVGRVVWSGAGFQGTVTLPEGWSVEMKGLSDGHLLCGPCRRQWLDELPPGAPRPLEDDEKK